MLISVIIPCFNVESYIVECIESLLSQTYKQLEIICVDNNSTDNTVSILNNYKERFPQLIKVLHEQKKGAPAARNKGLFSSSGEWIQFLDGDDILMPEKIEHQVKIVKDNNSIGLIAGASIHQKIDLKRSVVEFKLFDNYKAVFTTTLGNTCSNLFEASIVKNIGGWNEAIKSSQESDLMFRMLKKGVEVFYDNQSLTIIRERASGQISKSNPIVRWQQYVDLRIEIINHLKINESQYFKENKEFYYQNLFSFIRILAKYDLKQATNLLDENFENSFVPKVTNATTKNYLLLYKILGFTRTEKIKSILK